MKVYIQKWIELSVTYLVSALICYLTYLVLLFDLTKFNISFLNWLGILIISALLFPKSQKNEKSSERIKVSRDVFKNGF